MIVGKKITHTKTNKSPIEGMRLGSKFIRGNQQFLEKEIAKELKNSFIHDKEQIEKLKIALNEIIEINNWSSSSSFKKVFKKYLSIEKTIIRILTQETGKQIDTELISIVKSANKKDEYEFIDKKNIKDAMGNTGRVYTGVVRKNNDKIKENYSVLIASSALSEHLNKFIPFIENNYLDYYGDYLKEHRRGFIADMFMQHVAREHFDLLRASTDQQVEKAVQNFKSFRVSKFMQDEVERSKNNTRWTSGGDVIVINTSGKVLLNVQIKSSLERKTYISKLSMDELQTRLFNLRESLENYEKDQKLALEKMSHQIFKMYETSAIVANVDTAIDNVISDEVTKTLTN